MSSATATQRTELPDTSAVERHGYLFGFPIAHSLSPIFHNTVYEDLGLKWNQFFLESTDMELFLKVRQNPKFYGMCLTSEACRTVRLTIPRCSSDYAAQDGDPSVP